MHQIVGGRIHKRNFAQAKKAGICIRRFLVHFRLAERMRVKMRETMRAILREVFTEG